MSQPLFFQKFQCTFSLIFPLEFSKTPLKCSTKNSSRAKIFSIFLMHFFKFSCMKFSKTLSKCSTKNWSWAKKFCLDFCLSTPSKCPTKKSAGQKIKKSYTEIWIILRLTKAWNLWFPFIIITGVQNNFGKFLNSNPQISIWYAASLSLEV